MWYVAEAASASCAGARQDAGSVAASASSTTCVCIVGRSGLLTMYAKNEAATIPGPVLKRIKEEIDGLD